jgi:hypothetical protein
MRAVYPIGSQLKNSMLILNFRQLWEVLDSTSNVVGSKPFKVLLKAVFCFELPGDKTVISKMREKDFVHICIFTLFSNWKIRMDNNN